ncbi:hypothetical protein TPHV1_100045 [Treponema phagedenis]|uniref:Uncharacterized protein n=1 Tax=Treponema phagedenis TaxID=162 RepID=A0A0B7GUT0_TREPH|nr:hypothetical protein TPHV1_100045 [Treponema phagedenis]
MRISDFKHRLGSALKREVQGAAAPCTSRKPWVNQIVGRGLWI